MAWAARPPWPLPPRGWRVVLSGRRADPLDETARLVAEASGQSLTLPLDARDPIELSAAHETIRATWGQVTDLVLAAGLNTPQRYWDDDRFETFERIVATNLIAVARIIDTVLPDLRARGRGQIVVVSSYSAWRFSPHAGVAYTASKTALAAICQSLNAQEARHGVRACHLCPGGVDTEFLNLRPETRMRDVRQDHAVSQRHPGSGAAICWTLPSAHPHRRTGHQPGVADVTIPGVRVAGDGGAWVRTEGRRMAVTGGAGP